MSHCIATSSCAQSQRSSLKSNIVSLEDSEAPLLYHHLDVPGVSDPRKCLLAAYKGESASSFIESRKCSSPVSLKQKWEIFLYVLKCFTNACIRQDLQQQIPMRHELPTMGKKKPWVWSPAQHKPEMAETSSTSQAGVSAIQGHPLIHMKFRTNLK